RRCARGTQEADVGDDVLALLFGQIERWHHARSDRHSLGDIFVCRLTEPHGGETAADGVAGPGRGMAGCAARCVELDAPGDVPAAADGRYRWAVAERRDVVDERLDVLVVEGRLLADGPLLGRTQRHPPRTEVEVH